MIGNHFAKKFGKRPPPGIIVTEVIKTNFSEAIESFGTAVSKKNQSFRLKRSDLIKELDLKKYVKKGDLVKRGQHVADAGDLVKTSCGGGMEHLHFHMSKRRGTDPSFWGSWRFLGKPSGWINPHLYWTGGIGKPECFVEGKSYPEGLLTLPVECKN